MAEFSVAASEHFLKIAGVEFPLDMMKNRLTDEYRCYQDKGSVSVKLGKLQNAMTAGLEQLRKPSHIFLIVTIPGFTLSPFIILLIVY